MEKVNIYEQEQFRVKILIDTLKLCTSLLYSSDFTTAAASSFMCIARVPTQLGTITSFCFSTSGLPSVASVPSASSQLQPRNGRKRNLWIIVPTSLSFCETILKKVLQGAYHVPSLPEPQLLVLVTSSIIYFPTFFLLLPISSFIL